MAKNGKLPKRIAGVKIPKKLRKSGGQVYALLQNPIVADLVAVGLLAAADAMSKTKPAKKVGRAAKEAAADTADVTASSAVNLGSLLALAAREGAKAIKANAHR